MALVRRNKELTHIMTRQEFLRKFLTLWSHQKIRKQKTESSQIQQIGKCINTFNKFYDKMVRFTFDEWRQEAKLWGKYRKKVLGFIKERVYYRVNQALWRWRRFIQE